ncbi:MAG: hypothetical protein HQL32_10590 [Planctomycetes bacterium]|nr:hypothetical protein [Planctomycetota bacterium]
MDIMGIYLNNNEKEYLHEAIVGELKILEPITQDFLIKAENANCCRYQSLKSILDAIKN